MLVAVTDFVAVIKRRFSSNQTSEVLNFNFYVKNLVVLYCIFLYRISHTQLMLI